ncbi:MAG: D-arabinono-1,4-lactone oxidase [Actinomycetota bacterium]
MGEGGRIYLAKDSRMNPRHLSTMYPRLNEFRSVRDEVDPNRRFVSNLGDRLGL